MDGNANVCTRSGAWKMRLIEPSMMDLIGLCYAARKDEQEQYEALIGKWDHEEAALGFYMKSGIKFSLIDDSGIEE